MLRLWLAVLLVAGLVAAIYTARNGDLELVAGDADAAVAFESGTLAEIMIAAQAANKPVMIDFYATWCGPCKKLSRETFRDPAVVAFTDENLLCAKVDVDQEENKALTERYMVFNYPTILFVHPDGSEIDRRVGFMPPDEYLQLMQNYLAGVNTYEDYLRRVEESPDDLELNYIAGDKLAHRLQRDAAHRHLEKVLELDPRNESGKAVEALFSLADLHRKLAIRDGNEAEWTQAVGYARQAIDRFPGEETTAYGLGRIAYYHKKAGKLEAAADVYRELIALKPGDTGALNAFAWFCATQGIFLEEATEKAQEAAELSDGAPGILDTLAEVYHARGLYDEAITTIKQAIEKEPDDSYLRDQLEKFETAKRDKTKA